METPKDWQKEVFEKYPSLHKAITGAKMNIFGTKNAQNDLVKLLNIKYQLKADKEELLERLKEINSLLNNIHLTDNRLTLVYNKNRSLIQKHKQ